MGIINFVITDYLHPDLKFEEAECKKMGVSLTYYQNRHARANELIEMCKNADVILVDMAKMSADVIRGLKKCKLILRHGIGYDNIDVQACNEAGITVGNFPSFCVKEVTEQTIMLMMACQRKLFEQNEKVRSVTENGYHDQMSVMPIHRLRGSTLGILGFGQIGSVVYEMLQGFGVNFLICDPYLAEGVKKKFNITTVDFDQLLRESDLITIHVPLKPDLKDTYHMFDKPQFEIMKNSSIIINTSRGPIINCQALDEALLSGKIAGAGLDVFEDEPIKPDSPLLKNPKVILTPHMSWLSVESVQFIRESYIDDVRRFVNKKEPKDQVNPETKIRFPEES